VQIEVDLPQPPQPFIILKGGNGRGSVASSAGVRLQRWLAADAVFLFRNFKQRLRCLVWAVQASVAGSGAEILRQSCC